MRADQERVRELLTDTVTLLCKNGLHFDARLRIEGVLGITIDETHVFIVHINESISTNENSQGAISVATNNIDEGSSKSECDELQPYQSIFKHKRRIMNQPFVQPNQSEVAIPTLSVQEDLTEYSVENNVHRIHADQQKKSDGTKDAYFRTNVPITDQSESVVKSEIFSSDNDRASIIDLDNDDEAEDKFESYCSKNVKQLLKSNRSTVFDKKESKFTNIVDSKLRRTNHVNRRYKMPVRNLTTTESNITMQFSGESEDCKTSMGINDISFSSGEVRASSDNIKEVTKYEADSDQLNDDDYWKTNMGQNVDAEFGIPSQKRRLSYFDPSQSDHNNSLLYPAWQVSSSRRSSTTGVQKPYKCPHAGCGLRFYHRNNVSRHCTLKHGGAGVRQRSGYPKLDSSYDTYHDTDRICGGSNIAYNDIK